MTAATSSQGLAVFDAFYRAGSLVFGGGHVVLPLLEAEVVRSGWVTHDQFLAGYGAAQAVPGPLFTFAAYLGVVLGPEPNGLVGAGVALVAVFLPGFLLLVGVIPFWDGFRKRDSARALMRGTNAAVVGILGAALYDPVFTSAIVGRLEIAAMGGGACRRGGRGVDRDRLTVRTDLPPACLGGAGSLGWREQLRLLRLPATFYLYDYYEYWRYSADVPARAYGSWTAR
jgi:chromate transport protein ChrA